MEIFPIKILEKPKEIKSTIKQPDAWNNRQKFEKQQQQQPIIYTVFILILLKKKQKVY